MVNPEYELLAPSKGKVSPWAEPRLSCHRLAGISIHPNMPDCDALRFRNLIVVTNKLSAVEKKYLACNEKFL